VDSHALHRQAKALVEKTESAVLHSRKLVIDAQVLILKANDLRRAWAYVRRSSARESVSIGFL
jgi:hypothetical protein